MKHIFDILEDGGVVLINVPNGQKIIDEQLYHQIIGEHINYFTPFSFAYIAHKFGFEILEIVDNDEYIELDVYLRKPRKRIAVEAIKKIHKRQIRQYCKYKKQITVWGAGAKAVIYSRLLDGIKISHLIDSADDNENKYIMGIECKIEKPSNIIVNSSDIIIIFASSYNKEIIKELRSFNYKGEIIIFEKNEIKLLTGDWSSKM